MSRIYVMVFFTALWGCADHGAGLPGAGDSSPPPSEPAPPGGDYEGGGTGIPSTTGPEAGGTGASGTPGTGGVEAGLLTAGAWDDNLNFDRFLEYRDSLVAGTSTTLPSFSTEEHQTARDRFGGVRDGNTTLDVALVIDTTGSMSDEIAYLQTEFAEIANDIGDAYPDAEQRWALILYRDVGDEYVVRTFDFDANPATFQTRLAAQRAVGGGDFPEAPHAALEEMNGLSWRTNTENARLAFWVADAPHHAAHAASMATEIRDAAGHDVHIYPVASSGVNEMTEFTMRASAQLTGGRYLFLTNDSGIGGDHKEPTIPCYFVTRLNDALIRMVDIELSGDYREPTEEQIVRTGGDPMDGACTLESGEIVQVF